MKQKLACLFFLTMSVSFGLGAQTDTAVNRGVTGIAVGGYDPVAYFISNEALPGDEDITTNWNGTTYHFSSEDNRLQFIGDPEAFLPEYGGYCAWAVGQGYLADVDPEAWSIHQGRLYLNYNRSIQRRFQRDIESNISAADANWPGLRP